MFGESLCKHSCTNLLLTLKKKISCIRIEECNDQVIGLDFKKHKSISYFTRTSVYLGRAEKIVRTSKLWQTIGDSGEQRRGAFFYRGKEETGEAMVFLH